MTGEAVVHVVDDHQAVRRSLAFLLASAGLPVRLHDPRPPFLQRSVPSVGRWSGERASRSAKPNSAGSGNWRPRCPRENGRS